MPRRRERLPNHHPQWANPANDLGAVPPQQLLDHLTMVLSRSVQQETAFEKLIADQQNPASPDDHHWLTPEEVGARFGLSDQDISNISGWLQSQGLHVNWISQSDFHWIRRHGGGHGPCLPDRDVITTNQMASSAFPCLPIP